MKQQMIKKKIKELQKQLRRYVKPPAVLIQGKFYRSKETSGIYLCSQVALRSFNLIALKDGNRWTATQPLPDLQKYCAKWKLVKGKIVVQN